MIDMSVTTIKVCDRCGKPFEHSKCKWSGYFKYGIRKENRMHFHAMSHGNPDGYSYCDYRYDLCRECTEKLMEFLQSKD